MSSSHVASSLALAVALAAWAAAAGAASAWRPAQNVEIVVPAGPGGAIDQTARLLQELFQAHKLVDASVSVANRAGGGHSVGYAYLVQQAGNPHYLLVTSVNLVTNHIGGTSRIHFSEMTPIALLFNEYTSFVVAAGSPLRSANDLGERLRTRPESLSIGVGSAIIGANAVATTSFARAAGGDARKLKLVTFKSAADAATALMGGHIDVIATSPRNAIIGIASGKLRPVAVASPKRLGGSQAQVPTLKEQGFDVAVGNWRVIVAPKALTPEEVGFWDGVMAKVVATPRWIEDLERNAAQAEYLPSRETRRFLEEQEAFFRAEMRTLGLAK